LKPVAITGIGLLSPLGTDGASCARSLLSGRSGLSGPAADGLRRMGVGGVGRVQLGEGDSGDRVEQLALAACRQALAGAGLLDSELPPRTIAAVASSKGAVLSLQRHLDGSAAVPFRFEYLSPSCVSLAVARQLGCRGGAPCRVAACATGLVSVLAAAREVAAGRADLAVAGASEASLNEFTHSGFRRLGVLAGGNGDPRGAVRPFDRRRAGFLLGEGAAVFVLERPEDAAARGARVLARVLGGAELCEAHDMASPARGGPMLRAAVELAVARAGLDPGDLAAVWLHGTATRDGDPAELVAVGGALGRAGRAVPATAIKGLTGHLLGASGAVELACAVLCAGRGLVPAVANLKEPLPAEGLEMVRDRPIRARGRACLTVSSGLWGHAAAAVFEAAEAGAGPGGEPGGSLGPTS
jgi:3-oxoacyl-[acyl-carrier-protein] synthase II